jgi:hypothetical protein
MSHNPELSDNGGDKGEVDPLLHAQAERISDLTAHVLENGPADWDDSKVRYRTPLGPDFRLDVTARAYYRRDETIYERDIEILHNESGGSMKIGALMVDMNYREDQPVKVKLYVPEVVTELLERDDVSDDVKALINDAVRLDSDTSDEALISRVNAGMTALLHVGSSYHGRCLRHHQTSQGDKVTMMVNTEEGIGQWQNIDTKPEVQVRVEFDGRAIDMIKEKNSGKYETLEVDPDTGSSLRAAGGDNVAEIGGMTIIFDDGSMEANENAIKEAVRAMGLRDLKSEYLDRIESALQQVAAERF